MSSMEDVPIDDFTNGAASIGMGSVEEAKVIPAMPTTLVGMAIQSAVSSKPNKTSKKEM
jgi:hypothetical protein